MRPPLLFLLLIGLAAGPAIAQQNPPATPAPQPPPPAKAATPAPATPAVPPKPPASPAAAPPKPASTPKPATPAPASAPPKIAATPAPTPTEFTGFLSLVRYDLPTGRSDGFAFTRQIAQRKLGQDAIDWPDFTLNGTPVFRTSPEEKITLKLRTGAVAASFFQTKTDDRIEPGNHWLRAMEWRGGRRHIYTVDRTARTSRTSETMTGRYELWTFPVRIAAEGAPVKIVELKAGGATIYKKDGPWRSLTLLLPANTPGKPYELSVDSRLPVKFDVGLMPIKAGLPKERMRAVEAVLPGSPAIRVTSLERPEVFPHPKEWAADLEELKKYAPASIRFDRPGGWLRSAGVEVPLSPITIYAMQLPQGLSGGFYQQAPLGFTGTVEEYAAQLATLGFDAVFDQVDAIPPASDPNGLERRAAALVKAGVKLGFQYDNSDHLPALAHPEAAFYAHTLPEWHAPLYRSLSLAAQRFGRLPNFIGFNIGATSDGYAGGWFPAPPIPDRPWALAMQEFLGVPEPAVPRLPTAGGLEQPYEYIAKTTADFQKYTQRYETSFRQYGYFAEAVRQVSSRLVFTTGSFGSSPGPGARGGWPWASVPGRVMFEGLNVQQAYDWNQTRGSKPMHNVALTDRLSSYWPKTPMWSLLDNTQLLFGREGYQRACVLALTRGIQGIGTNFLPTTKGPAARPDVVAFQREMHGWIHRYGGVYARSEPLASIGVFYGQQEAVQRGVLLNNASPDKLLQGSHEGKTTEALFLCHAAGWPARIVTYQEILRGPLPPSMQAILLVGTTPNPADAPWGRGFEAPLQNFIARGGRVLVDEESKCAVPHTDTGLRVAAYEPQNNLDPTPILLARNQENIARLRAAMQGAPPPLAVSEEPKLWAIPSECGDTQYVTAVNQAFAEGEEAKEMLRPGDPRAMRPEAWKSKANASLYVKPQKGTLAWHSDRPIYDVRQARKLTPEEAVAVDLTADAFAFYALPPAEPGAPEVVLGKGTSGYYEATVAIANPGLMRGVPVKLTLSHGNDSVDLYGASGFSMKLPLTERDTPGRYEITATELLSGLQGKASIDVVAPKAVASPAGPARLRDPNALVKFLTRRAIPLVIALTPDQERDGATGELARKLAAWYKAEGRPATIAAASPEGIVESLQPLKSPNLFPQWKTAAADLILFGTPNNNVLILDQIRGEIFPFNFRVPAAGNGEVVYTRSPFVGELDAVNIIAPDIAGLTAAANALMKK